MPARGERLGLGLRVRLWSGDEDAHRSRALAMKSGPARLSKSSPASRPILSASLAGLSISTKCHSLPSGVRISPRNLIAPFAISARPAIGVLQEPSSAARNAARRRSPSRKARSLSERKQRARRLVIGTGNDADRALRHGGQHLLGRSGSQSLAKQAQDDRARGLGEQGRVGAAFIELRRAASRHCRAGLRLEGRDALRFTCA